MPINNQSIGRDLAVVLTTSAGPVTFNLTEYDPKPQFTSIKSKKLSGETFSAGIPDGWKVTFKMERENSSLDDMVAQNEDDYFNGVVVTAITAMETISEPDGSVSQFRYTKGSITGADLGNWKPESFVGQSVEVSFSRRQKVS
jgi:hypothetical protein